MTYPMDIRALCARQNYVLDRLLSEHEGERVGCIQEMIAGWRQNIDAEVLESEFVDALIVLLGDLAVDPSIMARRTGFREEKLAAWVDCEDIPEPPARRLVLIKLFEAYVQSIVVREAPERYLQIVYGGRAESLYQYPEVANDHIDLFIPVKAVPEYGDLSDRAQKILTQMGVYLLGEAAVLTDDALKSEPGCGVKTWCEITGWLQRIPVEYGQEYPAFMESRLVRRIYDEPLADVRAFPPYPGLSPAAIALLEAWGIHTYGVLLSYSEADIEAMCTRYPKILKEIREHLANRHIKFGMRLLSPRLPDTPVARSAEHTE